MEDFESKYSGEQIDALLDQVASGNAGGGGGGITVETDPIFSASPAASITEEKIALWDGAADLVPGHDADISQLFNDIGGKQDAISDLAAIREGAAKGATAVQEENLKTINGESIVGSGDITISGGSGEKGDKGDKGDTGVGVQSVAQTTTSNADGGSNVVTVTLTNGTTSTFTVKNGSKGSQGIQGEQGPKGDTGATGANGKDGADGSNGKDGADGEDGATFTPSVDSAGNLSWSNDKGLANPPTVNIKGPKGDKGDAGEGGGSSGGGGVETITLYGGYGEPLIIEEMLAEKRYYLYVDGSGTEESIVIGGFEGHEAEEEVTIKHFYAVIECVSASGTPFNVSLSLPDVGIRWSTGTPIPIMGDGRYELSITQINDYGLVYYNAVLTPFNSVE